ncbi:MULTISPECIES: hypothetical protein [Deefgea]|uniref:HEPN AbiU2-like domain-containing protein n=1 Tax=Deefgea chitinilytica TaxID=570276 RepID=A0ABS2CAX4_9NEIS|nr:MULTISPECIES: hypothetical protein [Deefgea]MBM5571307.1 hypothetical protein [Deefgea chitinilytica]MBM9888539.1 hypothetical protein [Deefgea sp. CFH1-16]
MPFPSPPPNWDREEISKFFDEARLNEFATFAHLTDDVARLLDIDRAYRVAISGLNHSQNWFSAFFVIRAHSNFLAACRMSWSGQIPESYALLRSCLENALYGLYLARNPDSRQTWLCRHDSEDSKKKVKKEFQIKALIELAIEVDAHEGDVTKILYDRTIDFGAHPNERALMQTLQIEDDAENIHFKVSYLDDDSDTLKQTLRFAAQVGICALSLFYTVYAESFQHFGVVDILSHAKDGL